MSFHASEWPCATRALLRSYGAASGHVGPKSFPGVAPRRLRFGHSSTTKPKRRSIWLLSICGITTRFIHRIASWKYRTKLLKGCPGCGKIRKEEFEQFIFSAMQEKFKDFQILHGQEEKVNPKLTAYQVELAQVEAEIEKLLDTLTGANATLLAYANKKIEELDTRRQTISKAIADLSVETISPQQIKKLSYYLDNWESIDFDDKRKAADGLISTIKATSDRVQIEWKI